MVINQGVFIEMFHVIIFSINVGIVTFNDDRYQQ